MIVRSSPANGVVLSVKRRRKPSPGRWSQFIQLVGSMSTDRHFGPSPLPLIHSYSFAKLDFEAEAVPRSTASSTIVPLGRAVQRSDGNMLAAPGDLAWANCAPFSDTSATL